MQHIIKKQLNESFSAQRISKELYRVQESILIDKTNNKNKYVIPSKPSEDVLKLYRIMGKERNVIPFKLETC